MRDNSFVYDFYAQAARWTVNAKNRQLSDLYVLIKSLVKLRERERERERVGQPQSILRCIVKYSGGYSCLLSAERYVVIGIDIEG